MTQIDDQLFQLAEIDPDLDAILQEHLADNEGEFLSTVFLADVARWVAGDTASQTSVVRTCELLEDAFVRGDATIKDVIGTGFVESLPAVDEPGGAVLDLLPPALRQVAEEMGLTEPWHTHE